MHLKKLFSVFLFFMSFQLHAAQINVAVASNFSPVMAKIVKQFEQQTEHSVTLIAGSTGKIYAQIHNGAPFDAFFAADTLRPQKLEEKHQSQPGSRFTYAIGKIVLWSPNPTLVDTEGQVLASKQFRHLAIANPKLAPYGLAAQQVLKSKHLWDELQKKIVRGENIGQTFHFVKSGNAELGFIALSQIKQHADNQNGSIWLIPNELYKPIEQQAVQLTTATGVEAFLNFVKSETAQQIILDYGYDLP